MSSMSHGTFLIGFIIGLIINVKASTPLKATLPHGQIGGSCVVIGLEPPCLTLNAICVEGVCLCAPSYRNVGNNCVHRDKGKT